MRPTTHTLSISLSISLFLSVTCVFAPLARAEEAHADIWVTASGNSLLTGGWDHTTGEIIAPSLRVFEGELGIDPAFPFSGDEPGIGSDLVGTTLTMNLLVGLGAWNGAGFDASTSVLLASYGGQDALSSIGGSFNFLVSPGLDLHPEYTLLGAGGGDPANGIYLASFTFSSGAYATSDTLFAVLNLGMSELDHEAAVAWTEANLVPAPGAIAMLAPGAIAMRALVGRTRGRRDPQRHDREGSLLVND